jgi:hypothetical protein
MTDRTEGPSAEQEVEHLAGQCATLLRENEQLRSALNKIALEGGAAYDMQTIAIEALGWRKVTDQQQIKSGEE